MTGERAVEHSYPVQCQHCGHQHDGATVEVVQRYSDCSVWRCPGCQTLIDDRPQQWGGCVRPNDPEWHRDTDPEITFEGATQWP